MVANDMHVSLNLSGAGANVMANIRAVAVYRELKRQREVRNIGTTSLKIRACSSGALVAIAAICFPVHSDALSFLTQLYNRLFAPGFLCTHVMEILTRTLPQDAHKVATSCLSIGVCTFNPYTGDNESTFVDWYETRDALIETIVDSCTIPFITGRPRVVDEYKFRWDGVFVTNDASVVGTSLNPVVTIVSGPETLLNCIYPHVDEFFVVDMDKQYTWAKAYIEAKNLDVTGLICQTQIIDSRGNTGLILRCMQRIMRWNACTLVLRRLYRAFVSFLMFVRIISRGDGVGQRL